ncbi:MAG: sulfatase [Halanaeroarchaeum sp.]
MNRWRNARASSESKTSSISSWVGCPDDKDSAPTRTWEGLCERSPYRRLVTDASPSPVDGVLLITVDSLRADALGGPDSVAPTIERLAQDGVRFENAFAAGNWTPFSFPSILGPRPVFADGPAIGVGSPTLAETLSEYGVATGGFNAANGFLTSHWGYDRGFDEFETFTESDGSLYGRYLAAHPTVQGWIQLATSPVRRLAGRVRGDDRPQFLDASRLIDLEARATDFIESVDGPFFLWIHYMDTHTPYVPAPRHLREVTHDPASTLRMIRAHLRTGLGLEVTDAMLLDLRSLYEATVHQVDASVGRLLNALEASGRREDTAIVLAGDHGEEFMEHGHLAHYPKLYDELTHVPYVVDYPGADPRTVEDVVSLDTIPTTIADALDVPVREAFEGPSLVPVIADGADVPDRPALSTAVRGEKVTQQPIPKHREEGELLVSARSARWTYVHHAETGEHELYDRRTDPDEQANVWLALADEPGVQALRDAAIEHVDRLDAAASTEEGDRGDATPAEIERQLEALGYQ